MVRHYVEIFVYVFVLNAVCKGQSHGVFIVYPFKEGDVNQSKAKFSIRKFENEVRREPKMLNDTNLHLVYPTYDDIIIMTPAPMPIRESYEPFLDTTIMMNSDLYSEYITTTNTADSYTHSGDVTLRPIEKSEDGTTSADEINETSTDNMTTEIPIQIQKSEPSLIDILYEESGPTKTLAFIEESEDEITTAGVTDATAIDEMTTEIPIQIIKSPESKRSLVDIVFEETGPMKTLRKRMFEASKVSRKYPSGLKMTNDLKIPTTKSSRDVFKNWYRKTSRIKAVKYRKSWVQHRRL